jgi:hypothetical protein
MAMIAAEATRPPSIARMMSWMLLTFCESCVQPVRESSSSTGQYVFLKGKKVQPVQECRYKR